MFADTRVRSLYVVVRIVEVTILLEAVFNLASNTIVTQTLTSVDVSCNMNSGVFLKLKVKQPLKPLFMSLVKRAVSLRRKVRLQHFDRDSMTFPKQVLLRNYKRRTVDGIPPVLPWGRGTPGPVRQNQGQDHGVHLHWTGCGTGPGVFLCEQTKKLKTLPSRRPTYTSGKYHLDEMPAHTNNN